MCVLMLGIFSSIFTTNILCNYAHAVDATGLEHDHPYGHDHHHDSSAPMVEHDHKDKGQGHDHDSGKDCCVDFTFTFLASLQRDFNPSFELNHKVISVVLLNPVFIEPLAGNDLFNRIENHIKPPPKIPDIRVFIQSFQI